MRVTSTAQATAQATSRATAQAPAATLDRDAALRWLPLLQGAGLVGLAATARGPAALALAALWVGLGLWWNSNTVSHYHLHRPLLRGAVSSRLFTLYLTALLGVPQSLWRSRHLWHHAGAPAGRRAPAGPWLPVEVALVIGVWLVLLALSPRFFMGAYLPGYGLGLALCQLQGHQEHAAAAAGVSHYGWLYNWLFFNDGYHAEHHRHPTARWSRLPLLRLPGAARSPYPAVLRPWARAREAVNQIQARALVALESLPLRWDRVRRFMLRAHAQAFAVLLRELPLPPAPRIAVVGGGLFPRTVLVLQQLLPASRLTVLDTSAAHIARARAHLAGCAAGLPSQVTFLHERYDPALHADFDLLVVPLGYVGDRDALYEAAASGAGPTLLVHDWLWRRRGTGARVSLWLLKRLNLVRLARP